MRKKTENRRQVSGPPEYRTIGIFYKDKTYSGGNNGHSAGNEKECRYAQSP